MRRIAAIVFLAALAGAFQSCSSDAPAPTPPKGGGGGGTGSNGLLISLFTTNANPTAGNCTQIQAIVTFNGKAVDDGTGVVFTTDFGTFNQNGLPLVSIVTSKGSAFATLCSTSTGNAFVNASATFSGVTSKSDPLKIAFQSASVPQPFFSSCSPAFGANTGGTPLVISGGRFSGDVTTTRATFTAAGVTREAPVTAVTATTVTLTTPAFPEAVAPSVPVAITLTFLAGTGSPITLAVPNCFAFGTVSSSTPTITALLPSSGSSEGGSRVSIIGSGFSAPVQVFFGTAEVQVVSITFNQIVVVTPLITGAPGPVAVRVHEVTSGADSNTDITFLYVEPIIITAFSNNIQSIDFPFTPMTIFGRGFQAPVAVTLAGVGAFVNSVSATELLVTPGSPFIDCARGDITGLIAVTNIDTGSSGSGGSFTYVVRNTARCAPTPTPVPPPPTATPIPATPTPAPADLAVTKAANPAVVAVGGNVSFDISVRNVAGPAANVVMTDALPANTTFISCTPTQGSCNVNLVTRVVTANLGSLGSGAFANVSIVVSVQGAARTMTNTAGATTTSQEINFANNTSTATVTVTP